MTDITDQTPAALPQASREAGLARLESFAPAMGRHYATKRNFDFGPGARTNVAGLSPHIRHRLVLESEAVKSAILHHGYDGAEKFIQEVCWRTYWKGWLEMRPGVWSAYRSELDGALSLMDRDADLTRRYRSAVQGQTGLAPFDAWARELVEQGYLHNHARMWFASIWVFTLELPWVLGADFFYRHLMDGDAASNTLSWRWVSGLHTPGKTYLARASNIEKYTNGRFRPEDEELSGEAEALYAPDLPDPVPPRPAGSPDRRRTSALLIHDEDLNPESWGVDALELAGVYLISSLDARSRLSCGDQAMRFTDAALDDAGARAQKAFGVDPERVGTPAEAAWRAAQAGASQIVTMGPAVGPMRDSLNGSRPAMREAGVDLVELRRSWDDCFWPLATGGFFKLKKQIPRTLSRLGLDALPVGEAAKES